MPQPAKRSSEQLAAHSALQMEVAVQGGEVAQRVQLFPMGTSRPRNGTPPVVIIADRAHAQAVLAATASYHGQNAIVVDYDHQTVRAPSVAGRAVAAGWLSNLCVEDDGIWADVEWTATAAAELSERKYRYISPAFHYRPDGRVTRIINAGLTNTPNLDLAAVASALSTETEKSSMIDLKALASALGLAEDADEAAIMAAIAQNKAAGTVLAATASALGAKEGDDLVALASAAKVGKPDPAKFVPVEAVAELQASMSSMQTRLDDMAKDRRLAKIEEATKSGKLSPALRKHAETLDEVALASFLGALPETGLGRAAIQGDAPNGDGQLTADELAVASAFGMKSEEFLEAKKGAE